MRVMFMWSGGVESTSIIKHYLETTSHEVFAHYIRHSSSEGRVTHEDRAVESLLPHLQAIRPLYFSSSRLDLIDGAGLGRDLQVMYPIGLVAMRHFGCCQLNRGLCMEDNWYRALGHPTTPAIGPNGEHRHVELRKVIAPLLQYNETLEQVAPVLPEYFWPKARHWHNLGTLAYNTWSCRRPKGGSRCYTCHSCIERLAAQKCKSSIPEVQVLIDKDPNWRSECLKST